MDNLEHQIRQFWEERTSPEQRREILRQLEDSGMDWREFMLANYGDVLSGEKPGELSSEQKSRVWERLQEQTLGGRVVGNRGRRMDVSGANGSVRGSGRRMDVSGANGSVRGSGRRMDVSGANGGVGGIGRMMDVSGVNGGVVGNGRMANVVGPDGSVDAGGRGDAGVRADDAGEGRRKGGRIAAMWKNGLLPWMAAACVLLVVAVWLSRLGGKVDEGVQVAQQSAAPQVMIRKNVGAIEDSLLLPDHSVVLLAPGSSVRYQQGFEVNARHIQLEGKALFEVAKDSLRPFTVTAHGYATTALATRFVVDATKPEVSIRLINGKIVVNSAADAVVALQKVYLMPGQELKISNTKKHFILKSAVSRADEENNLALSFERTSLNAVFQRLGDYYHIPIRYDKAEVQGLSFTGNFKSGDGLDLALKVICNVNQLSFVNENGRIVVSKQQ